MGSVAINPLCNESKSGFGNQRDVIHMRLLHLRNWVVWGKSILWVSAVVWVAPPKLMLKINCQCGTVEVQGFQEVFGWLAWFLSVILHSGNWAEGCLWVWGYPGLHNEFQANLIYKLRLCLNKGGDTCRAPINKIASFRSGQLQETLISLLL